MKFKRNIEAGYNMQMARNATAESAIEHAYILLHPLKGDVMYTNIFSVPKQVLPYRKQSKNCSTRVTGFININGTE